MELGQNYYAGDLKMLLLRCSDGGFQRVSLVKERIHCEHTLHALINFTNTLMKPRTEVGLSSEHENTT